MSQPFYLDVEGVGRMQFRRRTMRDMAKIGGVAANLSDGAGTYFSEILATLAVLRGEDDCPWNPLELDALDDKSFEQIQSVHKALLEKEASFRAGGAAKLSRAGESA